MDVWMQVTIALAVILIAIAVVFGLIAVFGGDSKKRKVSKTTDLEKHTEVPKGRDFQKFVKYGLYALAIFSVGVAVYKYLNQVLGIMEYVGIVVGIIFLVAGIWNFRKPLGDALRDFWEALGGARNALSSVTLNFLILHVVLIGLAVFVNSKNQSVSWVMIAVAIAIAHGVGGLRTMSEQEKGVIILFGRILRSVDSGLYFAPWPMRVRKISKTGIKIDFGTIDPEERAKIERSGPSSSWFILEDPMHTEWGDIESYIDEKTGKGLTPAEKAVYDNNPLAKQITTDPHVFFIMKVWDFPRLISEVGGFEEAVDRIRDICHGVLSEKAGKSFAALAQSQIGEINLSMKKRVEELIGDPEGNARLVAEGKPEMPPWGIDVTNVVLKKLGIHHDTNTAAVKRSADILQADGEARATIRKSVARKTELTNEGEGQAASQMATNAAEADRIKRTGDAENEVFDKRAKIAGKKGGRVIIAAESVEAGLKHGKTVIVPADFTGGLVSSLLAGKEAWDGATAAPKKPAPPASS